MSNDARTPTAPTPHDGLFRLTFERPEHAAGMLRALLPAKLVHSLDLSRLELVPGSFTDPELQKLETDLLFRATIADHEALVYVVLEHQSRVDPMMAWRMHRYVTRVLERWAREHPESSRLPVVLPVVVAHAERPWKAPTALLELFETGAHQETLAPYLPCSRFVLVDLATLSPEDLRKHTEASALGRLALFLLLRARRTPNLLEELAAWGELWRQVAAQGQDDVVSLVLYTWVVAKVPPTQLRAFLSAALPATINPDDVMTAAERLIRMIGPSTWLEEGRADGKADLLLRQLSRRFGPLDAEHENRVRAASVAELDVMAERVLDAKELGDVLGE